MKSKQHGQRSSERALNAFFRSALIALALFLCLPRGQTAQAEVKDLSINGDVRDGKARLVIEAQLNGLTSDKSKLLYATALEQTIRITREKLAHTIIATFDILQGDPKELSLVITGDGEIKKVTGDGLLDWSVREETNGTRSLVLRPRQGDKPVSRLAVSIVAEHPMTSWTNPVKTLSFAPPQPALFHGYVKVESSPEFDVQPANPAGLVPIEVKFLPEALRTTARPEDPEPLAFRFHGSTYALPLNIVTADPEARRVVLRDFQLKGQLENQRAGFSLTATARVKNPRGASLALLSGGLALSDLEPHPDWRLKFEGGLFVIVFDKAGDFPLRLNFNAAVHPSNEWNRISFRAAPGAVQPISFQGLAADTQLEFAGAAKPERSGEAFVSFLPPDGAVNVAWKPSKAQGEGKLFYAAEMLSQLSISSGLMRQLAVLDFKVMQGEINRVILVVRGQGNVTAVQGTNVLAWNVEPVPNSTDRRLVVQLNQAQKDSFALQVQMQTELGAFPQAMNAIQLRPEGATRFAGHFRVVNEGAVRLEVTQATGLSQLAPEQFPESDATRALLGTSASQRFVYRFSSPDFALRIQADNVLPEVGVSELLAYHLGETETIIDAELELDIREAPLREILLRVPKGYVIARLQAPGLSDYFIREPADQTDAELRIVYGQPLSGRQVIQLRLERNAALGQPAWTLSRLEVINAKTTRGHIAVSADAGFRLTPDRTQGLTDIATAFFPRKIAAIQAAFRLSDPAWSAVVRVERLPQSIQADVFHLFSIGEGIAYGSSTISYQISGAPVAAFRVELSNEYFNVEFTGKDVRNWQKTNNGYLVQLHTPVSGSYTLLATCERPFKAQGDTLTFAGARPLDAQNEQGHTLVISAYQFQVNPVNVSPGLFPLETAEVPPEYRLFFDAPILAAYRYTSRPFNLQLALSPLAQGETLGLVVDRASLTTRISKEGEVLTDARYFVKNRGNPNIRIELPDGTALWSATVNNTTVVPVKDGNANLIALPQHADPNSVQTLDLKLASRSGTPRRVTAATPIISAPVLLAEWKIEPDTGQRLIYRHGSLAPTRGVADASGFAGLARIFHGDAAGEALLQLVLVLVLIAFALWAWHWAAGEGTGRFSVRHLGGLLVGIFAVVMAVLLLFTLRDLALRQNQGIARDLSFLAPVQQGGSALSVEMANVQEQMSFWGGVGHAWPALLAIVILVFALVKARDFIRGLTLVVGWSLLAWAALRWPNGAPLFFMLLMLFLLVNIVMPAFRAVLRVPRKAGPPLEGASAPVTALLFLGGLLGFGAVNAAMAQPAISVQKTAPIAESVVQQIQVEEKFAMATAKIRWRALKGQLLPVLFEPAVLTDIIYPTNSLKLVQANIDGKRAHELQAQQEGPFDIELHYQLQMTKEESGFALPTQHGLVNRLTLTLKDLDVEISAPNAVSVQRDLSSTNATVATLVLAPVSDPWIGWKPRSRDVKHEKAVFFVELFQLYAPVAGVVEGLHQVQVRPAQGELNELIFNVPATATITDVIDPAKAGTTAEAKNTNASAPGSSLISLWRFDPDTRKLRVSLNPPQSRPFTLVVRSQIATGPLPFTQAAGLLNVDNAAGELGSVGIATGSEVQLDTVTATGLPSINLEDFPTSALQPLTRQISGLTLRRAFRYTDAKSTVSMQASAVEPDVRVETQETLSLGEDRTLLAVNATVSITRAGIFRVSFVLPAGLEVESISGPALSHWTELVAPEGRIITLHLKGKTEGQQLFAVSLTGAGAKAAKGVPVPRLLLREATKQQGQLVIVPEQGMRVQVATRDGVTQLDPQKSGIRQKGVLAFRLLQPQWALSLDVEQVDAWVQVTSLQHVSVSEAQFKVAANLQYQIENTGLKSIRVRVPTNAESVHFRGEQVSDFLPVGPAADALQTWEVKLHRRIIGKYLLQATWQTPLVEGATNALVRGIQAIDANLQRGFVTVQSAGRLQLRADQPSAALQPAEWQSIPRLLRQDIEGATANYTFRLVEPAFQLALQLERHDAAKLLPARVNNFTLTSVVSDEGVMLTQVKLNLVPGDKRLLYFTLPSGARFWFAFVNQNGVWPWRDQDRILIPLEQQSRPEGPIAVELFYSSRIGSPGGRKLDLSLVGPKIDLPLENITWQVYLNDKWRLAHWQGTLQLQDDSKVDEAAAIDLQSYLQNEVTLKREKTKAAEEMLAMGNTLLERGDPQQARRAFQSAFGLSTHDDAFNEDARVQLHNLKLQQALIGLNVRQGAAAGEAEPNKFRDLRARKAVNYTQQEAKQIIDSNSGEDNAALMRLAERLIQQQDAAISSPTAIRASIPQQGRLLTFRRTVQVDPREDLKIMLETRASPPASLGVRIVTLAAVFVGFAGLAWLATMLRRRSAA